MKFEHCPIMKQILLILLFSLIVAGCGNSQTAATTAASTESAAVDTPAPTAESVATTAPSQESATASQDQPAAQSRTFTIDSARSQAKFHIDELLRGSPKTVEGVTTVEGAVTLNPADLSTATIADIIIDARSFKTDSGMRDGAIRRFILGSNDDNHRYIIFTPTAIKGLPASASAGEAINFEVTGDLKIYETVKSVTFAMTVTATSETEITGSATATVLRSDFGLTIPNVPSVANVADEVPLFLDFVATAQ